MSSSMEDQSQYIDDALLEEDARQLFSNTTDDMLDVSYHWPNRDLDECCTEPGVSSRFGGSSNPRYRGGMHSDDYCHFAAAQPHSATTSRMILGIKSSTEPTSDVQNSHCPGIMSDYEGITAPPQPVALQNDLSAQEIPIYIAPRDLQTFNQSAHTTSINTLSTPQTEFGSEEDCNSPLAEGLRPQQSISAVKTAKRRRKPSSGYGPSSPKTRYVVIFDLYEHISE